MPRPRSEATRTAILSAARAVLLEQGLKGASIEAIAARAGAGKQTIYRWWGSRGALLLDAFAAQAQADVPVPDTGAFESDLRALLTAAFAALEQRTGTIVRALMAEALAEPAFAVLLREHFIAGRRGVVATLVARAAARGEIGRAADPALLADLVYGPMWYRLLNRHAPLDAGFAAALAEAVARVAASSA